MLNIWKTVDQSLFIIVFLFPFFKLMFTYSCLHFPPMTPPTPAIPTSHPWPYSPLALSMCPFYMLLDKPSSVISYYPSPLSSMVTVSLFFISMSLVEFCLLVFFLLLLLIRFHLQVRSYGICPSPPGLFYLGYYSPVPSMLLWRVGALSFFLLHSVPLCKWTSFFFFIHSFINGHLGCFQHLTIVNCPAMNIGVHKVSCYFLCYLMTQQKADNHLSVERILS